MVACLLQGELTRLLLSFATQARFVIDLDVVTF